jgi:hypothetical protein
MSVLKEHLTRVVMRGEQTHLGNKLRVKRYAGKEGCQNKKKSFFHKFERFINNSLQNYTKKMTYARGMPFF